MITFAGSVRLPTSTGTVVVEAEQGHKKLDPRVLIDVPVASQTISSGTFTVPVPKSIALTKAEVNGWVPFVIVVESGKYMTEQNISVPVTDKAVDGSAAVNHELASHSVSLPAFSTFYPGSASPRILPPQCEWARKGPEREKVVRIGQIHLTKLPRLKLAWDYGTKADTTMSVGYSESANGDFTSQGTYTVTNSIGTDSGFSARDKHYLRYIDGQAYFQRYSRSSLCVKPYKLQLDHMVGNSWIAPTGKKHKIHPKANPYHGCLRSDDPFGNAQVHPGAHFSSDRARAASLSGAASLFGFSFAESTGYTSDINHDYVNNTRQVVYLCGKGNMPNVPILYNNKT